MARIRVLPHRVADEASVTWSEWSRVTTDGTVPLPVRLEAWDYAQQLALSASPMLDSQLLLESTGLTSLAEIELVATADCTATQRRFITRVPIEEYLQLPEPGLIVLLEPGSVANELTLACHVGVSVQRARDMDGLIAHMPGSRLATSPSTRVVLEGSGGRFPTEAVSFTELNWEGAAWSVRVKFTELSETFNGSVRLFLNTDHPVGQALADMEPQTYASVESFLRIDIIRQAIAAVTKHIEEHDSTEITTDDESIGAVVSEMCSFYIGKEITSIGELLKADPQRFERTLQERVGVKLGRLE